MPPRRQPKAPAQPPASRSAPPAAPETAAAAAPEPLPQQEEFYRAPVRFGNVPVARQPMGWDPRNPGFRNHYPIVNLPTQIAERVPMGNDAAHEPNRLIWGDNLHVMRQIDSASVDLIYIDPPFFSGRNYNVMWGDNNERRSFEDIWEGGLDGYLVWLNARLYEMKRILKPAGSIYVHCDWHASHYIKVEMDKIFGYPNFRNELVWHYRSSAMTGAQSVFPRKHDVLLFYTKGGAWTFNMPREEEISENMLNRWGKYLEADGRTVLYGSIKHEAKEESRSRQRIFKEFKREPKDSDIAFLVNPSRVRSVWSDIPEVRNHPRYAETIGYPTQKPERLLERIIETSSNEGDVVADFFIGGGTTAAVAQRLGRRFIACDQSRVAVAVTAERLKEQAMTRGLNDPHYPDFTIEQWGVYDAAGLEAMPPEQFREFILHCYDARIPSEVDGIHGYKGGRAQVPVWVGAPSQESPVTAPEVDGFAQAILSLERRRANLPLLEGVMLAWGFSPEARAAALEWGQRSSARIALVQLEQVRIDSDGFRQHIASQSTDRADYAEFLTFVEPPEVRFAARRIKALHYEFNAQDSRSYNVGGKIINVQWDFDYNGEVFHAARLPWKERESLKAQHTFRRAGNFTVACRIQDDKGGEATATRRVKVE